MKKRKFKKNRQKKEKCISPKKGLEMFLEGRKHWVILGLWIPNLFLIDYIFGDYMGNYDNVVEIILTGIGGIIYNEYFKYWIKKYGLMRIFSVIGLVTVIHLFLSMCCFKPLKSKY